MRQGWEIRKLGQVFRTSSGGTPSKSHREYYDGGCIKWLRSGEVSQGEIWDTEMYITEEGVNNSSAKMFPVDTVVIAMYGATVGQVGILKAEMTTNQAICGIFPNPSVHPSFLSYFLKSHKSKFLELASGAAQPNISQQIIKETFVPVPPIAKQELIVAELDCLTGIIDKKKQQLEELDKLAQSIFYDMFGNKEYKRGKLISLCADKDDIKCGPFGTQLSKREFLKEGVPVWGIPQVNSNFAIPPTDFVSEEKALALQSFSIIGGDIVMSRKGNIGQSAIYPTSFESGILHSDVLRIRVKRELANPLYLVYQFHQSAEIKHQFKIIGYGAIMPGLNVSKLKSVIVDIPPITIQNEFAQKVEAIEKQRELIKQSIVETETLFNCRMDYWFN